MKIDHIIVNTRGTEQDVIPNTRQPLQRVVEAIEVIYPEWTSMVITLTNRSNQGQT
jgi:hypothetical protein